MPYFTRNNAGGKPDCPINDPAVFRIEGEWFLDQAVGKIAAKHSAARNVSGIASETFAVAAITAPVAGRPNPHIPPPRRAMGPCNREFDIDHFFSAEYNKTQCRNWRDLREWCLFRGPSAGIGRVSKTVGLAYHVDRLRTFSEFRKYERGQNASEADTAKRCDSTADRRNRRHSVGRCYQCCQRCRKPPILP